MYRVEGWNTWFITNTRTKKQAYSEGVLEFGRGNVKQVSVASQDDITYFTNLKGIDAVTPSIGEHEKEWKPRGKNK